MIFYTKIDRFERKSKSNKKVKEIFSECGSEEGLVYEYRSIDGIKTLVPCGVQNYQDVIDSFAESSDINVMISKFLDGDTSVMNPSSGTYGDFTDVPKTYAELFERVQQCKNVFESMPADLKEKFDNSYESFWSQFGSEHFDSIFEEYNKSLTAPPNDSSDSESEVVADA